MSVKKLSDRFSSDKASAQSSLEFQVQFALDNLKHLRKVDPKGKHEEFLNEIKDRVFTKTFLFPNEKKRIDDIYELVWRGYGMEDAKVTVMVKRSRSLKY